MRSGKTRDSQRSLNREDSTHTKRAVISARRVGSIYEHVQSCCETVRVLGVMKSELRTQPSQ